MRNYRASSRFTSRLCVLSLLFLLLSHSSAFAGTASIATTKSGPTPFIAFVTANYSGTLYDVSFRIIPASGSLTRALTGNYSAPYLRRAGKLSDQSVTFSVFGLYAGRSNVVEFLFRFTDGSSTTAQTTITTAAYTPPCPLSQWPTFTQNRTSTAQLQFDYFLLKSFCNPGAAELFDTDGNVRWSGIAQPAGQNASSALYNNGLYFSNDTSIYRMELTDASVAPVVNLAERDVTSFHHNIDKGRDGLIADVNTSTENEATNIEFDPTTGKILNEWDLGQIISAAMIAGGDDPSTFVTGAVTDWFHNNATAYNSADRKTLIVSSRENFVVGVDYDTPPDGQKKIHWILGDTTKAWYQYPSLRNFALTVAPGTLPPIGQHAISTDDNGNLLLFDNGQFSVNHVPAGVYRPSSAVREYIVDRQNNTATAGFTYSPASVIFSNFCGSAYEAGGSYLVDFAQANNGTDFILQGVDGNQNVVFNMDLSGSGCSLGWNAFPLKSPIFVFP